MSTIKSLRFDLSSEWDGAGVTQARDDIDRLRQDIDDLRNRMITIDVDDKDAQATLDELRAKLDSLKDKSIKLMGDKADLQAKIDEAKAELDSIKDRQVEIKADAKEADADIAFTKARLDELHDKRIRIDVDSSTAAADMARLDSSIAHSEATLERLNQQKLHIGQDAAQAAQEFDAANQRLGNLKQSMSDMNTRAGELRGETAALAGEFNRLAGVGGEMHSVADGEKSATSEAKNLGAEVDKTTGRFRRMISDAGRVSGSVIGALASFRSLQSGITAAGDSASRLGQMASNAGQTLQTAGSMGATAMGAISGGAGMVIGVLAAIVALSPIVAASIGLIPLIFMGAATLMISKNAELKASFQNAVSGLGKAIEQDAMPLVKAMISGMQELAGWIKVNGDLIGGAFKAAVPLVQPMVDMITNFVQGILPGLTVAMQNMGPLFSAFAQGWGYIGASMGQAAAIFSKISNLAGAMQNIFAAVAQFLVQLAQSIATVASADHGQLLVTIFNELSKVMAALTPILVKLAPLFVQLAQLIGDVLVLALKLAMPVIAALSPILTLAAKGLDFVITKITEFVTFLEANFIGRLKAMWANIQQWGIDVKNAFVTAFDGIRNALTTVGATIAAAWSTLWNGIKGVGQAIWATLQQLFHNFITNMQTAWSAFSGFFTGAWSTLWNAVKGVGQAIWSTLQQLWNQFLSTMRSLWSSFSGTFQAAWSTLWNGVKGVGQAIWSSMQQLWNTFLTTMKSTWDTISGAIKASWDTIWNGIKTTAETIWNTLKTDAKNVWDTIKADFKGLVDDIKTIWSTVTGIFKGPVDAIKGIWNAIAGALGLPTIATGGYVTTQGVQRYASGGYISGPGGGTQDKIPAMISNGEFVMRADSVSHYGVNAMHAVNQGRATIMHFAGGGSPANPGGTGSVNPNTGGPGSVNGNAPNVIGSPSFQQGFKQDPGFSLVHLLGMAAYNWAKSAIDAIINAIPHPAFGTGPFGDLPWGAARKLADGMLAKIFGAASAQQAQMNAAAAAKSAGGPPGGGYAAGSAQFNAWLQAAGIPQSQWGAYAQLALQESTFNPNAYNPQGTSSGNAAGLFQITSGTFAAYGSGSVYNPVDNARAAQAYINAAYGGNVSAAVAASAAGGYARGTNSALRGWGVVGETGPEVINFGGGERVDPFNKLVDAVNGIGQGSGGGGDVNITMPVSVTAGGQPGDVANEFSTVVLPQLEMAIRSGVGRKGR